MTAPTTGDRPNWKSPAYAAMEPAWRLCRDVRGGTETLRLSRNKYLPRFIAEDLMDWDARLNMTVSYDALDQTIAGYVGLGLRHDPELGDEVPPEIELDWENLDGEGNHGAVVAQRALDQALTDGHMVLLTEAPPAPEGLTSQEESDLGLRPYVVRIGIDRILSWRTQIVGGQKLLAQIVFQEEVEVPVGTFTTTKEMRYRVYRQRFRSQADKTSISDGDEGEPFVEWELWREAKSNNTVTAIDLVDQGVLIGPTRIPVAVVYGGQEDGILCSRPPLKGLAESNIRWTQIASDRAYTLHKCGIIVPVVIGKMSQAVGPDGKPTSDIVLSSSRGMQIELGGDFKFAEPTGTSLAETRTELNEWEKRMGTQALSLLQQENPGETATAAKFRKGKEESKLGRAVRSLEDALELSLQFMADYRGLDRESIDVTIRRDFSDVVDPQVLTFLSSLEERKQLTLGRLLIVLGRAGVLGNDFDPEEELQELERQMDAEPMGFGFGGNGTNGNGNGEQGNGTEAMDAATRARMAGVQ